MPKRMDVFLVLGLALGLTVAVHTTANAGIDKSTVEAGRVHIQGKIDTSHELVVRIDRDDKPIEWRSSRAGGGEFEVVVEASDKIRLEDGKTGHGFVVTTKILTSSDINYVHCAGDLAGTFAIRREADFVTKDGVLTFADVTLKDGKKLAVSLRLALSRIAAVENKLYGPELILTGHTGRVLSVCVSADGKRLLTCSDADKTLRLWDAYTGKCLRVFEGHTDGVLGAALSPDGKRVLSGGGDKTVRLWDADTGKELRKMTGHTTAVCSVAFGPEGQALSGGGRMDGTMRLWDLNTGKQAAVFNVDGEYNVTLAYSAKARLAATYTWTRIRLWDLETGKEVRKLSGHGSDFFESVSFSPDGERLLSASSGGPVCIWDVKSGKELRQIQAHKEVTFGVPASCAAFSPDGKRIVSGGKGGVRVWDAESGNEVHHYEGDTGEVFAVAFFPDGKRIASSSVDGIVRIWRAPR